MLGDHLAVLMDDAQGVIHLPLMVVGQVQDIESAKIESVLHANGVL